MLDNAAYDGLLLKFGARDYNVLIGTIAKCGCRRIDQSNRNDILAMRCAVFALPRQSNRIRSRFACRYLFVPNQALAAAIEQWTAKIAPLGAPVAVQIRTRMAGDEADEFRKAHLRQRRAVARDARALQSTLGRVA